MSQLSLFDSPQKPIEPVRLSPDYVRKHLLAIVRRMREARIMFWHEDEARGWEERFPELTARLEPEEGARIQAAFETELARLRQLKDEN